MKRGDIVFLDTNVLLSATDASRSQHSAARQLFSLAGRSGVHLALSGQILREYAVVATRPLEVNGLGLGVDEALSNLRQFRRRTVFLDETEVVWQRLEALIATEAPSGKRIHDANVVAIMQAHAVTCLVTDNTRDFQEFADIRLLTTPQCVSMMPSS